MDLNKCLEGEEVHQFLSQVVGSTCNVKKHTRTDSKLINEQFTPVLTE